MRCLSLVFFLFIIGIVKSQNKIDFSSQGKLQYGVACKLNVELQPIAGSANFKLSLSTGIGYDIEGLNFSPTLHAGVLLFNRGVIGSSLQEPWSKVGAHFFYSTIGTVKLDHRSFNYLDRYLPFYHFSDFSANPLQHPYKSSFSFGRVWVRMPKRTRQALGFFNLNVAGRAQISYYNDGGPILKYLGDKRDRYYTGGVVLSYHGNEKAAIDMIEVSYHKFTGYVPHAFDISDKLRMDFVVYADRSQFAFNHQRWKINVSDFSTGFSAHAAIYDLNSIDLQDFLHFTTDVPYHPDYFQKWRLALGGRYEYNYLRLQE